MGNGVQIGFSIDITLRKDTQLALHWKNCSYEYKRVHAIVDWGKGENIAHKACK